MRNIRKLRKVQDKFDLAMQRGDAVLALAYLREMTARALNAECELKEDMQQTICQLEVHCDVLERSNNLLGWFVVGALVLGTCYGQGLVDMVVCGYDYLYNWLCI